MRRFFFKPLLAAALALALACGGPLFAAPGGLPSAAHGDSSPEWERLRDKLFAGRRIEAVMAETVMAP